MKYYQIREIIEVLSRRHPENPSAIALNTLSIIVLKLVNESKSEELDSEELKRAMDAFADMFLIVRFEELDTSFFADHIKEHADRRKKTYLVRDLEATRDCVIDFFSVRKIMYK